MKLKTRREQETVFMFLSFLELEKSERGKENWWRTGDDENREGRGVRMVNH
jgi:hypothetical protein